jgi:ParB family transcriptional regulator, chromosome partitioning protein
VNVRRGGLGRGLGALIPTGPAEEEITGARFDDLPLDAIEPNPRQPREVFDEEALAELVTSVREVGVLQPVVVRETAPGRYQLIMGERRWRACREAGLATVPAIIRETRDDALLRDALLENLHRQQLNPLEEAAAYEQLLQEFGVTHEELATRLGRSRSHVSNTLRLLGLPAGVQRRVAAGVLSAGHARALLALDDDEAREALATRIVAEGLSVRAVEEIVALGDGEPAARQPRTRRPVAPALAGLAERLSDALETRVSVELGRRRGKLVVQFATIDDLERIVAQIAPAALPPGGHVAAQDGTAAAPADAEEAEVTGW